MRGLGGFLRRKTVLQPGEGNPSSHGSMMSAICQIQDLVREKLLGRKIDTVGFIEALLALVDQVGEIQCSLGGEEALQFRTPNEAAAFEVELDAARGKLRMLCARLGVLCHECGVPDVSLYGGEGFIRRVLPPDLATTVGPLPSSDLRGPGGTALASPPIPKELRVRFKNTPSEQEFTIQRIAR